MIAPGRYFVRLIKFGAPKLFARRESLKPFAIQLRRADPRGAFRAGSLARIDLLRPPRPRAVLGAWEWRLTASGNGIDMPLGTDETGAAAFGRRWCRPFAASPAVRSDAAVRA